MTQEEQDAWMREADLTIFGYNKLCCIIQRDASQKTLCGYVEVPRNHPWHDLAKDYKKLDVQVHSGLSYGGPSPLQGDDRTVLGFHCAHGGDYIPALKGLLGEPVAGTYRTIEFVTSECEKLADQILAAT